MTEPTLWVSFFLSLFFFVRKTLGIQLGLGFRGNLGLKRYGSNGKAQGIHRVMTWSGLVLILVLGTGMDGFFENEKIELKR